MKYFDKSAQWIAADDGILVSWLFPINPAPFFRREFQFSGSSEPTECFICGLGYYELYVNGEKVDDRVLDPVPTQFDRRALVVRYDLTGRLNSGLNVIGVVLGNGWYNCHGADEWNFDKASWRDHPKFRLQLNRGNEVLLASDRQWKYSAGPIVYDELRCGETYDARLEQPGWNTAGFDDSAWRPVRVTHGPGGILDEQIQPPCRVLETLPPVSVHSPEPGVSVIDFGVNLTGWVRLSVSGKEGVKVTIRYGERLDSKGFLDVEHIRKCHREERFQQDEYICASDQPEQWEPRFTYHGFQYAEIRGDARLICAEARFVGTDFPKIGDIYASDDHVNRLHSACRTGYRGNFTGIPTDCPHREKNGWTADAHLAAELGLCNYNAASAYLQWLDSIEDAQRPDGQLPGIVPSAGWGFNWGNGPAWDSVLFLLPEYIYDYTGNPAGIEKHYSAMCRYLDYCEERLQDGLITFGLGDWACYLPASKVPDALVLTGYHYSNLKRMVRFAHLLGREKDTVEFMRRSTAAAEAFRKAFRREDGSYGPGFAAGGFALYFGLVPEAETAITAARLAQEVKVHDYVPEYGIHGNKAIPRALAENGYAETAYRILARQDYPGFFNCIDRGATTLWGIWKGDTSLNHIMYGDVDAWLFRYPGGLSVSAGKISLKPVPLRELHSFSMSHRGCRCQWEREGKLVRYRIELPYPAELQLPDCEPLMLDAGEHQFLEPFRERQ